MGFLYQKVYQTKLMYYFLLCYTKFLSVYYITTFIGTVIHEFAHKTAADFRNLEVNEVEYFTLDGKSLGYVDHEPPRTYYDMFVVALAPIILNTSISIVSFTSIFVLYSEMIFHRFVTYGLIVILAWFGLSTALHAFPSKTDVKNIVVVKKFLWKDSIPSFKSFFSEHLFDTSSIKDIIYSILVSPIWILITVYQLLKYMLFNPISFITFPIVYGVYATIHLKKVGLHIIYTVGLILFSQELFRIMLQKNLVETVIQNIPI